MTLDPISCPYCNALLTEVDPETAGRRILCPRCGETFPYKSIREPQADIDQAPFSREPEASGSPKPWSNRTIAFLVLAIMGTVAILFLGYALQTEHIRREHDQILPKAQSVTIPIGIAIVCNVYIVALIFAVVRPKERPGALPMTILLSGLTAIIVTIGLMRLHLHRSSNPYPEEESPYPPPVRSVAPAQLAGLGYLPSDTNVIAAIHVADLLQNEAGRNPLLQPGIPQLEQWTGLPAREIDHVILGLKVDDRLPPRVTVVVATTRPFSKTELKTKLKTGRFPDPEAVRFPSDRVIVLGLTPKDVEAMPNIPTSGAGHLSPLIQTAIRERIDKSARIWAVGASDNWEKTVVLGYSSALPRETRNILKRVQVFAIGMRVDREITLTAALKGSDEQAVQALERFLKNQKMEIIKDLRITQKNTWLTLQGHTDSEQIRRALNQTVTIQKK